MKMLLDNINAYKEELDYLKEGNDIIQKQFSFELQKVREELRNQKEENENLVDKIKK